MLNKPNINQLMDHADSKYTLVIVSAKRARYMIEHHSDMLDAEMINPVTQALNDIVDGKISWGETAQQEDKTMTEE